MLRRHIQMARESTLLMGREPDDEPLPGGKHESARKARAERLAERRRVIEVVPLCAARLVAARRVPPFF
jgi:hypothetical protein